MLAVVRRHEPWARCRYPPSVSHISPWYTSLVASQKIFHINIYNHVMSGDTISYHIPCVYIYISYIYILYIYHIMLHSHGLSPWLIPRSYASFGPWSSSRSCTLDREHAMGSNGMLHGNGKLWKSLKSLWKSIENHIKPLFKLFFGCKSSINYSFSIAMLVYWIS